MRMFRTRNLAFPKSESTFLQDSQQLRRDQVRNTQSPTNERKAIGTSWRLSHSLLLRLIMLYEGCGLFIRLL